MNNTPIKVTPIEDEIILTPKKRVRRPMKWYQKQFGIGFCYGLTVGAGVGALFVFSVDALMRLLIG